MLNNNLWLKKIYKNYSGRSEEWLLNISLTKNNRVLNTFYSISKYSNNIKGCQFEIETLYLRVWLNANRIKRYSKLVSLKTESRFKNEIRREKIYIATGKAWRHLTYIVRVLSNTQNLRRLGDKLGHQIQRNSHMVLSHRFIKYRKNPTIPCYVFKS